MTGLLSSVGVNFSRLLLFFFFFFKQKTAYEMRISDWSSDVCSSDLGHGLGRRTMPEMLDYSAVMAVYGFWVTARAAGVGVGWVSILDPGKIARDLDIAEPDWRLVAYLCVGWPAEETDTPELEKRGWEHRRGVETQKIGRAHV